MRARHTRIGLTLLAAVAVLGGLVRLWTSTESVAVAMPEPGVSADRVEGGKPGGTGRLTAALRGPLASRPTR
jgi:hypothetical protein